MFILGDPYYNPRLFIERNIQFNSLNKNEPPYHTALSLLMQNNVINVFIMSYIYLNASQYDHTLFSFNLFSCLK